MKISVWMVTRERETWINAAELLGLAMVLLAAPGLLVRLLVGLPLLVHIGYKALTSLPMGAVPGRPERGKPRRHYDLRACVVRFLDEVRRIEDHLERAQVAGWPRAEVEDFVRSAQKRVMAAATEVVKEAGRLEPDPSARATGGYVLDRRAHTA